MGTFFTEAGVEGESGDEEKDGGGVEDVEDDGMLTLTLTLSGAGASDGRGDAGDADKSGCAPREMGGRPSMEVEDEAIAEGLGGAAWAIGRAEGVDETRAAPGSVVEDAKLL